MRIIRTSDREHLVTILYETGLRLTELLGLYDDDIDFNANTITLTQKKHPNPHPRLIKMSQLTRDILEDRVGHGQPFPFKVHQVRKALGESIRIHDIRRKVMGNRLEAANTEPAEGWKLEPNTITCGDSNRVLERLPSSSIDMVITSPPYLSQRIYDENKPYTIEVFQHMASELTRVIKPGGVIVWNVGDSTVNGSEQLIPQRQALYFMDQCGLRVHDTMIYERNGSSYPAKRNGVRYSDVFEYVYIFSKGKPKSINLICDKLNRWAGTLGFGVVSQRTIRGELKTYERKAIPDLSPRNNIMRYCTGKNYSSKDNSASEHPAIMPDLLAFDQIRTWSNEGDIVLDPMAGSGTSLCMAKALNRQFIGIEQSAKYCEIIKKRLQYPHNAEELACRSTREYNFKHFLSDKSANDE